MYISNGYRQWANASTASGCFPPGKANDSVAFRTVFPNNFLSSTRRTSHRVSYDIFRTEGGEKHRKEKPSKAISTTRARESSGLNRAISKLKYRITPLQRIQSDREGVRQTIWEHPIKTHPYSRFDIRRGLKTHVPKVTYDTRSRRVLPGSLYERLIILRINFSTRLLSTLPSGFPITSIWLEFTIDDWGFFSSVRNLGPK